MPLGLAIKASKRRASHEEGSCPSRQACCNLREATILGQAQLSSEHWRERAEEIRAFCRQIADVRARDELLRIAKEYELVAETVASRPRRNLTQMK
jgi:hypothetical protein